MAVAFDANFISLLLRPDAKAPTDPTTGEPVARCADRIEELIDRLSESSERIVLPWPALAEFFIFAYPDHLAHLEWFRRATQFELSEFGQMAAIELVELSQAKKAAKAERDATWAKVKYDRSARMRSSGSSTR